MLIYKFGSQFQDIMNILSVWDKLFQIVGTTIESSMLGDV